MDIKKIAILGIIAAALVAGGVGAYDKFFKAPETNVSGLKGTPDKFLGKVVVTGRAGKVYPDKGVIEMVDDKGCCNIFLFVPMQAEQQREFQLTCLFKGELPAQGAPLTVKGKVEKTADSYAFNVDEVISAGKTLLTRID